MTTRCNIHYNRLPTDEDGDHDNGTKRYDPRFDYSPGSFDKIPWKSIALCILSALSWINTSVSFILHFIWTHGLGGETSQAYGLFALGILTFLPGFYETRIAYYSWKGAKGYRFSSIPNY